MRASFAVAVLLLACKGGCTSNQANPPDLGPDLGPDPLLAQRPFDLHVPPGYDRSKAVPLLILLHGYGANSAVQDLYFGLSDVARQQGFLYAVPDGTMDQDGKEFWNATDACCNRYGAQVDDVAYLRALIQDTRARYNVDAGRIYVAGHSNGGFMAYRLACDLADQVVAIVSLAGATWKDPARCQPAAAVSVLQIHGDADDVIVYNGGRFMNGTEYPSAHDTVAQWAKYDSCTGTLADTGMRLDLVKDLPGPETRVERVAGCARAAVELWTIEKGTHIPLLQPGFADQIYGFLKDHPRQGPAL